MRQRILITGAAGKIARSLRAHWTDHALVGLDRRGTAQAGVDVLVDLAGNPPDLVTCFRGVDTVVHLAAEANPSAPFASTGRNNIAATLAVVEACLEAGVTRLVYASSLWADARSWGLAERQTWYGASKIAGEALVQAWADQTGYPAVCLRPGYFDADRSRAEDALERLRIDETALRRHFDEALAWPGPGCLIRYAIGRLDCHAD